MKIKQLKIFLILIVILLTVRPSESDVKVKTFIKKVESGGNVMDALQTTDGDYVLVSRADASRANYNAMKVSALGKKIWERSFSIGVANGASWSLTSIAKTKEGYVLVGSKTDSDDSVSAAIIVALRSDGTVNWTKQFGFTTSFGASGTTGFTSVNSTPDGGFIARGWGYWDTGVRPIVMKFAPDGEVQWQKVFVSLDLPLFSQATSDNGLILVSQLSNGADIIKLDHSGNIVWKRSLIIKDFDLGAIAYDSNNSIVIAGKSTDSRILLLTGLDFNGKIVWRANYSVEVPFSISRIAPTSDDGYIMIGATQSKSVIPFGAGFLLKIDSKKHLGFQRTFGVRSPKSIFATTEGGFIVFGGTGYDFLFLSLNSDGIAPDCLSFHNLNSKSVLKVAISVGSSVVSSQSVTPRAPTVFDVTSAKSRHSISTMCQ